LTFQKWLDKFLYIIRRIIFPFVLSATKLLKTVKGSHIEKTDWHWVKLEDLLKQETGLTLHWSLESKLKHPSMGKFFKSLLNKKPKTEEDDDEDK